MQGNIKVVVRCRPLNARELARGATCLVKMEGNQTILQNPKSSDDIKAFTFDRSYWSAGNKTDSDYADQETVYNDVGREWLNHAFDGYNCCIFAYGQTGSGKSFSMMGYGADKGIIPRTCSDLFDRIHQLSDGVQQFQVEVSYIEIYNERVRDLLNPRTKHLKVREHPSLGPYVEDLSRLAVNSFEDIEHLMDEGNKARTVAATNMNETSSRSHAVFTIILTQRTKDDKAKQQSEKVSRFSLVDLAGSERANSTGASGMRLKEGANINRSLTTLGKVIAGLAEQTTPTPTNSHASKASKKRDSFIPYRDSVLTWLLKDSLGGNSKTAMIAAISPADFDETLSTLRYADQAKKIKTKAVVNEDPSVKMIRELKSEIQTLKQSLLAYVPHPEQLQHGEEGDTTGQSGALTLISASHDGDSNRPVLPSKSILITDAFGNATELTKREVVEQLKSSQKLLGDIDQSWEDRLQTTVQIQKERERALVDLGITVAKNNMGVYTPKNTPHLVNLNEDPLMSECLVYQIKPGTTLVSRRVDKDEATAGDDGDKKQYIRLSGSNILDDHCRFENVDEVVTLYPSNQAVTMVNGIHITEPKQLKSGYRIILGDYHVFRFNHPEEARREREQQPQQTSDVNRTLEDDAIIDTVSNDSGSVSATSEASAGEADWLFARREAVMHYFQQQQQYAATTDGSSSTTVFENLTNDELEKLFDDVTKMRKIRKRQSSHSGSGLSQPMSPCSSTSSFSFRHSATPSTVSTLLYENSGFYGSASSADDTESMVDREIIRLAREELQQQLDVQKVKYEKRIQRLSCLYPVATKSTSSSSLSLAPSSPSIDYSAEDISILAKVMRHWQDQRYVHLAETLLMNGRTLCEANALSRQLDKKVTYQLVIIHNTNASGSAFEDTPFLASRWDKTLLLSRKPCVGVRVIDSKHQCTYLWSLERLKTRLRYMQGIRFVTDQTHHLVPGVIHSKPTDKKTKRASTSSKEVEGGGELDLFYDSHPPRFTLIGLAKMRLRHLALHVPIERTLDVFCQQTCRVVGQLTVLIAPIARSKERQLHQSTSIASISDSPPIPTTSSSQCTVTADSIKMKHDALQAGQRLVFEIRVGALSGVNSVDFADVHVQYQLDSFKDHSAPHDDNDDDDDDDDDDDEDHVYTTSCKNDFDGPSEVDFGYSKAFSMVVTDHMLEAIQHGDLSFEVYGLPTATLLKSLHDEQHRLPTHHHQQQHQQQQQQSSVEKEHNVYAWVEICELAQISGEYTPVQVTKPARARSKVDADADEAIMTTPSSPIQPSYSMAQYPQGTFILRQGQQRRIVLTLRHDWILPTAATNGVDGDGLPLDGMDGLVLWIGDIRCRSDADDGAPPASPQDLSIPLTVMNKTTDTLVLQGAWDSSLHNSLLLNRLTEPGHTVDLTIKWVFHGAPFQMDLGVQITAGTLQNGLVKRQSLLRNIFSSSSTKSRNANKKRTSRDSGYSASSNDTNDDDDDDDDDDNDDDETKDDSSDPATSRTTTRQDKKTSVTGIYRVWERPRRLSSYFIHEQTDHHEWQQRQMDQIKAYDQARRSMTTKMEVANTRYTLALWDLLQNRHMSRGRRFSVLMENNSNDSLNDTEDDQQQKIPQQRLVDREDRMRTIIQQWMESKHQENTGLQLIHGVESTVSPAAMETPLYAIHQIALSDDQSGRNNFLMLQHCGYMKIRKLVNDDGSTEKVSRWTRRWFLLKRPYLLVYANNLETNELDVLTIQAVRVNPPVNDLVNTFTIYTTINTYQCRTAHPSEMKEWVASMI